MPIFHSLRVAAIDPLTDDAVALTFEVPEELRDEYVFTAGQHLSIRGADEKRRSFSIFTAPSSGLLRVGIKVLPGGSFSEGVLGDLRVGDEVLTAGGIYGTISRLDEDQVTVLIAPKTEVLVARRAIAGVTREPEADEDAEAEEPQEEEDEKWQSAFDGEGSTYSSETSDEEKRG